MKIGDEKLKVVPSFKYLGVTLDSALTFSNHIKTVLNTVAHKSYMLGKIRKYLTVDVARLIYKTMILPYLDYADVIFANAFTRNLDKLQRAQNKCLKVCMQVNVTTDTDRLHSMATVPLLVHRRATHLLNFMYLRQSKAELIDDAPIHTRAHDAPLFRVTRPRLEAYKRSVPYNRAVSWNVLNPNIRGLAQCKMYKNSQKKWLKDNIV